MGSKALAEAVAHFLYWSHWLELRDQDRIYAVEVTDTDMRTFHCGTQTFDRLLAALEREYPDWREWSECYSRPLDSVHLGDAE